MTAFQDMAAMFAPGLIVRSQPPMTIIMPAPFGRLPRATAYRNKQRRAKVRRKNRIAARSFNPFKWVTYE